MTNPPEAVITPPTVNDTAEQMEGFLKTNGDNTPKSPAMQAALDQVRANLEARQAEEARIAALPAQTEGEPG